MNQSYFPRLMNALLQLPVFAGLAIFGLTHLGGSKELLGSDQIPGSVQKQPIAIRGATLVTVQNGTIENATILFEAGKIISIGQGIAIPPNAQVIEGEGRRVYPGLFDSHSQIGLIEIESVRATVDASETGNINPNVRAETAVNPDSELIPVTRANGILLAMTAPTGGLIAGRSAVLQLDGWTWEDMTLRSGAGLEIRWPRSSPAGGGRRRGGGGGGDAQGGNAESPIDTLHALIEQTRVYQKARTANPASQPKDARLDAMIPVIEGAIPVIAEADDRQQIQSAVAFAVRHKLKLIIFGGYDAESCAELLKETNTPVIIGGIYRLPQRDSDDYDAPYTLPSRLQKAGVKFAIAGIDRFGGPNLRNLPYHAGTAVAYGLPAEEALRSITLSPAEILGVADRVGSLSVGKDATLFIADGDILETPTHVLGAFIQGKQVDLGNRHDTLFRKYEKKYSEANLNSR